MAALGGLARRGGSFHHWPCRRAARIKQDGIAGAEAAPPSTGGRRCEEAEVEEPRD